MTPDNGLKILIKSELELKYFPRFVSGKNVGHVVLPSM